MLFKRELRLLILMMAFLMLSLVSTAQTGVRVLVVNEYANVRTVPAIGASVLGTVEAGYLFENVTGRSGDYEWVRVNWLGTEGWVNLTPSIVLTGDINSLVVADPRTYPYGGLDGTPRAGTTSQTSGPMTGIATNGVRLRLGPSQAYETIANIFANQQVIVTGRTERSLWYQVIHEGFIGWTFASFIQLNSPGDINALLPVDGIAAEGSLGIGTEADDYVTLLRLMLARIDLAQISLDEIRAAWTDAALNGRATCKPYPARPSNIVIALPVLNAFFDTLDPLRDTFNDAMKNTRDAIDLFIEVCNQPGGANPVGSGTVQFALDIVNTAQAQYTRVRVRLLELIPPDRVAGDGECVLTYNAQVEILPLISAGTIFADSHTSGNTITGYCFDAFFGETYRFETLQIPPSNLVSFISISPLNNVTNFIGVARGDAANASTALGPITIPENGRYLIIISDVSDPSIPPNGEFAFLLSNLTSSSVTPTLVYDAGTGVVSAENSVSSAGGGTTTTTGTGVTCPDPSFTCSSLFTCAEAYACYNDVPNFALDGNGDGLPCNCLTADENTVPTDE